MRKKPANVIIRPKTEKNNISGCFSYNESTLNFTHILGENKMTIKKIEKNGTICAVVGGEGKLITDPQSALDLLMNVKYEADTKNIVIDKRLISEDFFILSTGLAGEILQKYVNYGGRIAVYGDYSRYTSQPLKDFMYESNKGKDVFFVADKEEAIERLTK